MEKTLKEWILLKVAKYLTNGQSSWGMFWILYLWHVYLYFRLAEEVVLLVLIELDLTDNVRI